MGESTGIYQRIHLLTKHSGFFITYMGSAVGTSPGRLVETDANDNIIHEWPEDVDSTLNIRLEWIGDAIVKVAANECLRLAQQPSHLALNNVSS